MDNTEVEKTSSEDAQLTRSRSFKSKQLVRSQAIRESTSPPRTASPYEPGSPEHEKEKEHNRCVTKVIDDEKIPVQIQITSGGWEEGFSEQRLRTRRWLGQRPHSDSSRDFLSYNPRITCVCGKCACPHCRGKRKHMCAIKQDSGIVCSVDCPDCSDLDNIGANGKSGSVDNDDQTFYCRCPERKEKPKTLSLSGNDADDKTDLTDQDLVNFLRDTLNKNPKDRITLLKVEKELHALVSDVGRCIVRFPVMTSYGRMLVHRVAALFQLAHHIDHANKTCVVVSKSGTSGGRIPCTSFKQWCTRVFPKSPPRRHDDTLAKSILKRAGNVSESSGGGADAPRSKSLEQRERDYERARRRIFSTDNCTQDESQWPWLPSGPVKLLTPEGGKNKLVKVQSLESRGQETNARGAVSKSHSFGGYTAEPQQPRLLSRQGDLASSSWRLSPSSSGYKTLSLRSTDSVTPSPTGGASPEPGTEAATLVWAVTNLSSVPQGAIVIHPQTGRPLTNPDGSIYHFDPANPPVIYQDNDKNDANEKRRGKLEKQHSFMVTECECSTNECRKCCCECRQNGGQKCNSDKTTPPGSKNSSIPNSPVKEIEPIEVPPSPEPIQIPETQKEAKPVYEVQPQRMENRIDNSNFEHQKSVDHQKPYETQKSFESQKFESNSPTNQKPYESPNQRVYDSPNQRPVFENRTFENHTKVQEVQYQSQEYSSYGQGFRMDEITPPPQAIVNYHQDVSETQMMQQNKITPIPIQDPNIRPVSITNMMYPTLPQHYPFVTPCRMDQQMQPLYQQMLGADDQKHLPPSPHTDNTFRIDPSYPYPTEFNAYGGCQDPALQRGYSMGYSPVEVPTMVPSYPVPNVILQPPIQHYPTYQEQIQWQGIQPPVPIASPAAPKLMLHDVYPMVCPNIGYQPYNVVYPQVLPQPYPICQPVYPIVPECRNNLTQRKRNSLPNSSRNTPQTPLEKKEETDSTEIAAKIQQIKEQMAQMNTKDKSERRTDWRANNGSGILGSYPANFNGRVNGRPSDEAQLSSAARAIVNSIRNIQAKNNYNDRKYDNRPDQRQDFRYRGRSERDEKDRTEGQRPVIRPERLDRDRNRGIFRDNPFPMQYRPPYLLRQMSPGAWCRRSPGPVHPVLNPPRRPHPDRYTRR
ncbi:R3H domain-containing protein 2 [Pieris brassicae]|uniref:R3H domain-containing protein 2 n=1 Tax=Pieris brassicae TaxID=7116 RepID=UPI001E65EFB2|nr:R3H domain-containing protein 2 [Pieris brassicae]